MVRYQDGDRGGLGSCRCLRGHSSKGPWQLLEGNQLVEEQQKQMLIEAMKPMNVAVDRDGRLMQKSAYWTPISSRTWRAKGGHLPGEQEARQSSSLALQLARAQMEDFLRRASHDLKTPLTSLKLGLQMTYRRLQRRAQHNASTVEEFGSALQQTLEDLALFESQVNRLVRLVNDLLDAASLQARRGELHLEMADLVSIVCEVVAAQRQMDPIRTICLQVPAHLHLPVLVDVSHIKRAVISYLTNALKYSSEDQAIAVGLEAKGSQGCVWVHDAGHDLPAEEQALIWECFHRAKGIEVQYGSSIGLGLGLYLCRTIIEWHQGQVGVQSAPGEGATFWFTLPCVQPGKQP